MSPVPTLPRPFLKGIAAAAAILLALPAQADQTLGNDPFREKDPGFFQRASNDVGNFFKRLFGPDEEKRAEKQATKKRRSSNQRYNLDHPPEEVHGAPAAANRAASSRSGTATPGDAAGSSKRTKSQAHSSSRGSTLIEEPPKSKSRTQKSAPSNSHAPAASTETAAAQSNKPRKQTDAAADSGKVLYSNAGAANPKPQEPQAKTRTETTQTPPKAHSEPPSVLTGTKTGKLGRVKSPYAPYSELDVTGLPSGSLALDPTTQKVFRIP